MVGCHAGEKLHETESSKCSECLALELVAPRTLRTHKATRFAKELQSFNSKKSVDYAT
jgi:hypothetical protein